MSNLKYVQPGYTVVTPYLYAKIDLVDFLKNALGAEITHTPTPDAAGNFHCEAQIGDAHILFGGGYFSDPSMAAAIYLYVPEVDATYKRALSLGAKSLRPWEEWLEQRLSRRAGFRGPLEFKASA